MWRLIQDPSTPLPKQVWQMLSEDELQRANRFVFEKDKNMFASTRGTLRYLLGLYLAREPKDIRFSYNAYGKPLLQFPVSNMQFNVSHSKDTALLVFAHQTVGVDVEYQDSRFSSLQIAQRFFSPTEVEDLPQTFDAEFVSAFFDCWSRKESYIKAKGMGVSLPLDSFATRNDPEHGATLLYSNHFPDDVRNMKLMQFTPNASFSGAIAVEQPLDSIEYFDGDDLLTNI